jgi:phosphatidylglycerol:prolipoprotein diacylglycerol transferase
MIFFNAVYLSPICCSLLGIDIYWYGIAYVTSLICAVYYAKRLAVNYSTALDAFIPFACIGIVIGGRLGHVIFFDFEYYKSNLLDVFKIRDGGMSFHGGFCGVIVTAWYFCKKRYIKLASFLDVLAMTAPMGLFFGRISNFINGELYGVPTKLPWGVYFKGIAEPRHPTQLYEAFTEGILTFFILKFYRRSKFSTKAGTPGIISHLFLFCYAISRFAVDFLKDTNRYMQLSTGQWLSAMMIICGIISYLVNQKKVVKLN